MNIVDAHHHVWLQSRLPWLQGPAVPRIFGPYEPLRRDYQVDDYLADVAGTGVTQSVFVQANVDAGAEEEEARWVAATAGRPGPVGAIVAFADVAAANLAQRLDRLLEIDGVRGIRQQLHWHEEPAYRFASRPDAMLDAAWLRGFEQVARRGLVFELQVFPHQYAYALQLVDRFPQARFVLLHAGMLADRSPQGIASWRAGLRAFALRPQVDVKLSGLGTFVRRCDEASWRPVIEATVDIFTPARCMFGSNFPVEKLWTRYGDLLDVFRRCIAGYSQGEQAQILGAAASRVYGLPPASPSSTH